MERSAEGRAAAPGTRELPGEGARDGDVLGRALACSQGAFWTATGLWPLLHLPSFEAVTGPKQDDWLVRTMGGLIACVGGTLLLAGRRRVAPEVAFLGVASAVALTAADTVYVARGRLSKVYLLDAIAEAPFIAGWAARAWLRRRRARGEARPALRWRAAITSFDPPSRSASGIAMRPRVADQDASSGAPIGWTDDTTPPAPS